MVQMQEDGEYAWVQDCIFDSCAASNDNLADYQFGDAYKLRIF